VVIDVCVYSEAGADFHGGDDAVKSYREDPDASVHERIEVVGLALKLHHVGRIA